MVKRNVGVHVKSFKATVATGHGNKYKETKIARSCATESIPDTNSECLYDKQRKEDADSKVPEDVEHPDE